MANDTTEILRIQVLFSHYRDENGDGVEVETNPIKNIEMIKQLSNASFITAAVISNAVEIVAHNSEAAIYIVNKYGDENLVNLLDAYTHTDQIDYSGKTPDPDLLNALLKFAKHGDDDLQN